MFRHAFYGQLRPKCPKHDCRIMLELQFLLVRYSFLWKLWWISSKGCSRKRRFGAYGIGTQSTIRTKLYRTISEPWYLIIYIPCNNNKGMILILCLQRSPYKSYHIQNILQAFIEGPGTIQHAESSTCWIWHLPETTFSYMFDQGGSKHGRLTFGISYGDCYAQEISRFICNICLQ